MMGYVYVHLCLKYNPLDSLLGMMYFTKTLRRIMRSPLMYSSEKVHMNLCMVSITWTCPTLNSQQLLPKYLKPCVCRGLWWVSSKSILGKDRSDIRYAVAGHSAYSMLAQVQREMRTCKFAGNWTPYLRTGVVQLPIQSCFNQCWPS